MISAKNLLTQNNLIGNTETNKRKPKNEFQAYAYRLAHDLNDLVHLQIYMKMAKNIDRNLMEQAYSYVLDSKSNEKGKIFLWKIKKLREEVERRRNKENFSYELVSKKMKEFRNKFAKEIVAKGDLDYSAELIKILEEYLVQTKKRVLIVGNSSKKIIKLLEKQELKPFVIDSSRALNAICMSANSKIISKDFLENAYKEEFFDVVVLNNYWHLVPVESEIKYLKAISKIVKKSSMIIVISKTYGKDAQEWKDYLVGKDLYNFFLKSYTKKTLIEQFEKIKFNLQKEYLFEGLKIYVFLRG